MGIIGQRIQIARRRAGHKTSKAGAAHCQMPYSSFRDYEVGNKVPGALALRTICRRFECDANWLLGLAVKAQG